MALTINKIPNINNNNNQCNESEMYFKWLTGSVCAFCVACGSVWNFNRDDKISVTRGLFITTMVRVCVCVGVCAVPCMHLIEYYLYSCIFGANFYI